MKDAEISLAVARIMYPDYEWEASCHSSVSTCHGCKNGKSCCKAFSYEGKACAWDMMVWLAERVDGGTWLTIGELLQTKNSPYKELAMSIIEVENDD